MSVKPKNSRTIVIPIANKAEEGAFASHFSPYSHGLRRIRPYKVTEYIISGNSIFVAETGVGTVSAAAGTQFLIDSFQPDLVLGLGHAKSLNQDLVAGDVCAINCALPWEVDLPQVPPAPAKYPHDDAWMNCDGNYTLQLSQICHAPVVPLITGDRPVVGQEAKELGKRFKSSLIDFEGAAIVHVSDINEVPCAILKIVTDLNLETANTFRIDHDGVTKNLFAKVSSFLESASI